MDICLHVFTNAATHALPAEKAAQRYVNGDIFTATRPGNFATKVNGRYVLNEVGNNDRFSWIFVTDFTGNLAYFNNRLEAHSQGDEFDPETGDPLPVVGARRRNFKIHLENINAAQTQRLTDDRCITITHDRLRELFRDKSDGTKRIDTI